MIIKDNPPGSAILLSRWKGHYATCGTFSKDGDPHMLTGTCIQDKGSFIVYMV
jgi:hypothetical protein